MVPYIEALDLADQIQCIRDIYGCVHGGSLDQSEFFASRGWNYERASLLSRPAKTDATRAELHGKDEL